MCTKPDRFLSRSHMHLSRQNFLYFMDLVADLAINTNDVSAVLIPPSYLHPVSRTGHTNFDVAIAASLCVGLDNIRTSPSV